MYYYQRSLLAILIRLIPGEDYTDWLSQGGSQVASKKIPWMSLKLCCQCHSKSLHPADFADYNVVQIEPESVFLNT